ncbi:hypothetical protein [Planctomicrobium sp. SH527]|uniref:hypothetical protein n=1 Tax=Planctomicrobium sp. SH527 TaxID=3448123 RepID=UPI003F5C9F88
MLARRISNQLALLTVVLCSAWTPALMAQAPSRPPAHPKAPRMGVIDAQNRQLASPVFTIAGGVKQSGVYQGTEATIPIEELIAAAGGLEPNASLNLRVLRNNNLRFQVFLDPAKPDPANRLMSGDIVLVQSTPAAIPPTTIPVVCVGLLDRPVVLPLDPTIQTLSVLTARLGQSPEVAKTARLVSPVADPQGRLLPGTIIFFAPQMIDRTPLQMPGALPEVLALKRPAVPKNEPLTVQVVPAESKPELVMVAETTPAATPAAAVSDGQASVEPLLDGAEAKKPEVATANMPVTATASGTPAADSTAAAAVSKTEPVAAASTEPAVEKPITEKATTEQKATEASESATANAPASVSEPAVPELELPPSPQVSANGGLIPPMTIRPSSQPAAGNVGQAPAMVSSLSNELLDPQDPQLDSGAPTAHLYQEPYAAAMGQVQMQQGYGQPIVSELNVHPTQMVLVHAENQYGVYREMVGGPEYDSGMVTPAMGMAQATTHVNTLDRGHTPYFAERAAEQATEQAAGRANQQEKMGASLDLTKHAAKSPEKASSPWGGILSTIFGCVFMVSAGLVMVSIWAPWKKYQLSVIRIDGAHDSEAELTNSRMQDTAVAFSSTEETHPTASVGPRSGPVTPPARFQNAVSDLVQRTLPVVEEQVVVPKQWPLHGQVVGHRRIILNQPHESIAAPHFPVESSVPDRHPEKVTRQSIDERALRANLRAAFVPTQVENTETMECKRDSFCPTPEESPSVSSTVSQYDQVLAPVETPVQCDDAVPVATGSRDFDIVQPDHSPIVAMSPLDRALRTLASEKRG